MHDLQGRGWFSTKDCFTISKKNNGLEHYWQFSMSIDDSLMVWLIDYLYYFNWTRWSVFYVYWWNAIVCHDVLDLFDHWSNSSAQWRAFSLETQFQIRGSNYDVTIKVEDAFSIKLLLRLNWGLWMIRVEYKYICSMKSTTLSGSCLVIRIFIVKKVKSWR